MVPPYAVEILELLLCESKGRKESRRLARPRNCLTPLPSVATEWQPCAVEQNRAGRPRTTLGGSSTSQTPPTVPTHIHDFQVAIVVLPPAWPRGWEDGLSSVRIRVTVEAGAGKGALPPALLEVPAGLRTETRKTTVPRAAPTTDSCHADEAQWRELT